MFSFFTAYFIGLKGINAIIITMQTEKNYFLHLSKLPYDYPYIILSIVEITALIDSVCLIFFNSDII